jgi:hypothetical protein
MRFHFVETMDEVLDLALTPVRTAPLAAHA